MKFSQLFSIFLLVCSVTAVVNVNAWRYEEEEEPVIFEENYGDNGDYGTEGEYVRYYGDEGPVEGALEGAGDVVRGAGQAAGDIVEGTGEAVGDILGGIFGR